MSRKRDLEEWRSFLGITEADQKLLAALRPLFERQADTFVAAFYRHLLSFEEPRKLLSDPDVKQRVICKQRDYFLSLCGSQIDETYLAERRRIGDVHEAIGLEPRWYLGGYSLYCTLLLPMIHEAYRGNPDLAERTVAALLKVIILDAQIAMESYIEKRQAQLEYANRELGSLMKKLSREVQDAGSALRESRRRARAAEELASVGTLVAGLAHEIGTPMGVIQGHAELLESSATDERSRWRARAIGEQIGRISHIIQTLLNIARPREPVREPVELASVLVTTLSFLTDELRRRNIRVERKFEDVRTIEGDHEKLQQLFLNLFLNAIDAMPDGGALRVSLARGEEDSVAVSVVDTGVGLTEDEIARIFEPFYTTKEAGQGSGLGLMVARRIVHDHDGEVEVTSGVDRGTEFRISFPVSEAAGSRGRGSVSRGQRRGRRPRAEDPTPGAGRGSGDRRPSTRPPARSRS